MINIVQIEENLKKYLNAQIVEIAKKDPMIGFAKPIITRALNNKMHDITKVFDLISDEEGFFDAEVVFKEMLESVMVNSPFTYHTDLLGDIEIGGGCIKMCLPFASKKITLNMEDLTLLKETLLH